MTQNINQLAVNTLRTLSIDASNAAIQVIQVFRWAQHRWLMHYGRII
ncbi:hypothetical protein ACT7DH_16725 [Bacillus pacificus]